MFRVLFGCVLLFSFGLQAEGEKFQVTQKVNFSEQTIKFRCDLLVPIKEFPSWVDRCNETTVELMNKEKQRGFLKIDEIPKRPYKFSSETFRSSSMYKYVEEGKGENAISAGPFSWSMK